MQATSSPDSIPSLRILIIGYYGHLNAGDDLLQQALTYIFQDHKLMFSSWQPAVPWLNECDLVVVGGGSIWPDFTFFQYADDLADSLRVPLMVLGISSRRQDPVALKKTTRLFGRARLFHVRDESTWHEFGRSPWVRKGVDLFWWMPWSADRKARTGDRVRTISLNLRDWGGDWQSQAIFESIRQFDVEMNPLPLYFGSPRHDQAIALNDADFLLQAGFEEVGDHWSEWPLLNSDLCIAMRYHAIMLSVRAHIPVIGFDFHPKMVSFFRENELDELCVPLNDLQRLRAAVQEVISNYAQYVDRFREIARRLEDQGAADLAHCRELIASIQQRPPLGLVARALRKGLQYAT